jgi:hypothetical protein
MRRFRNLLSVYAAIGLMVFGIAGQVDAQRRNEREVRDIIRNLTAKIDDFQYGLDYQLKSSSVNRQDIDGVTRSLRELQDKVDEFDRNFAQRRENRDDVNAIVSAAKGVDSFLDQNGQNQRIETDWNSIRDMIGRLAGNYGVTPDWNGDSRDLPTTDRDTGNNYPSTNRNPNNYPAPSSNRSSVLAVGLTGTYQLDNTRSENSSDIISRTNVSAAQKDDLQSKLDAPEQISLDIRGNQVTLASSKASPVSFVADGRDKTERDASGRNVKLRATLRGTQLTISSLGGESDYTVTFLSTENGRTMKVTRRITTDYLSETVFAESIYNKTESVASLGIDPNSNTNSSDNGTFSSNDPNDRANSNDPNPTFSQGRTGDFIVPHGTVVTGLLESTIDTKVSQNNDRFKLTVQSPDEFRGAVIEGYLTGVGRSGQVSGRSNVTFNFERITLRNGQSYDFAGYLQGVKDQNGKVVKVDTEGTAKGDSQTKETVKRGGIGAGLGAIIGAIAGGGKGAAIGAVIGGGAGAGSVIVQGRDDVQLLKGSTITIQATAPNRGRQPQEN